MSRGAERTRRWRAAGRGRRRRPRRYMPGNDDVRFCWMGTTTAPLLVYWSRGPETAEMSRGAGQQRGRDAGALLAREDDGAAAACRGTMTYGSAGWARRWCRCWPLGQWARGCHAERSPVGWTEGVDRAEGAQTRHGAAADKRERHRRRQMGTAPTACRQVQTREHRRRISTTSFSDTRIRASRSCVSYVVNN